MRTSHDSGSSRAKRSTAHADTEEAKLPVRPKRESVPPYIPGLYPPGSVEKDVVRAPSVIHERQKLDGVLEARREALAAEEAAKNKRIARQRAQQEKRQQEDYGASRKAEQPRASRPSAPPDPKKGDPAVVVDLKVRHRSKYVNRKYQFFPLSRTG